jgi:ADP-ribose pyrophosphatase
MAPTFSLGTAKLTGREPLQTSDAKFLSLSKLRWIDEDGKQRVWESADRKTRSSGGIDAVAIFALLSHPRLPLSTILVLQYRPPVGKVTVELPAGLIDEGESPSETALRELIEETGYGSERPAEVDNESVELVNDPGVSPMIQLEPVLTAG